MKPSAAGVWLDAWERCMSVTPVLRPVVLLEAHHGVYSQAVSWPLGHREAELLRLRSTLFGTAMESVAACPACGGIVEFTLRTDELLEAEPAVRAGTVAVEIAGNRAEFRLPATADLHAAAAESPAERRRFLLERCVVNSPDGGDWPEEFIGAASRKMAEADPLGDVSLNLKCAGCGGEWTAPFDAGAFLWAELNAWASRLMSEIHLLASHYGWTEPDILALPPHRRAFYLGRLQAA